MIGLSAAQHSVVQLSERRLVQRLQRGELRVFQELRLSRLVGADEGALRHARASVAYGLVNAGDAP